jgi:hypothetical protein
VRVARTNGPVDDAERARRLEPEASVVRGTAEQNDQREARPLESPEQLGHQGGADARTLVGGRHRQGGDGDHVASVEITKCGQNVSDHGAVSVGNQLEPFGPGAKRPGVDDNVDLFVTVAAIVRERVTHHRKYRLSVARPRGPNGDTPTYHHAGLAGRAEALDPDPFGGHAEPDHQVAGRVGKTG